MVTRICTRELMQDFTHQLYIKKALSDLHHSSQSVFFQEPAVEAELLWASIADISERHKGHFRGFKR